MSNDHAGYRPDIDGLRAVAVASVLVFHAFPGALPGGFIGVDIFFVISGYLISGIILRDLVRGRFTFRDFYIRRVRRIFPALGLMLLATLLVGWWGLLPADFRQLGGHVAGGVGFVSNLLLWAETGYFDVAAELKPLLHLWSLGVEEQYYLLWPVGLFIFRRHVHRIFWLILAVALASFAANIVATARYPDVAFYWPIPRFWELMVGSLIAYAQVFRPEPASAAAGARWSGALATAGVLLLLAGLVLLDSTRAFPGWWALLPTGGAALLICAGPSAWFNRLVLSNKAVVYIGLISYPLYLWHWPLLAFARIFNGRELPPPSVRAGLLLAALVLAVATYELLEKRIRRARNTSWSPRVVPVLLATLAALGLYGLLAAGRYAQSRSAAVPQLTAISEAFDDWDYGGDRLIRGDVEQRVLFFGDSHMQQYLPRIEWLMKHHKRPVRSVQFRTLNGCAPFPGVERRGRNCVRFVQRGLASAREAGVDTVVIGSSWKGFMDRDDYFKAGEEYGGGPALDLAAPANQWVFDEFESALRELVQAGKRVVIVGSSPRGPWFDPRTMVRKEGFDFVVTLHANAPLAEVRAETAAVDARLRGIAQRIGATLVDPVEVICSATECPALDAAGNPLYKDETHLRSSIARERFDALDRFVYAD